MPRLEQRLVQKQILAPQQILHATLLQLNSINLEDRILEELENNPEYVDKVIAEGAEKARKIASETVKEVKEKMGLG